MSPVFFHYLDTKLFVSPFAQFCKNQIRYQTSYASRVIADKHNDTNFLTYINNQQAKRILVDRG